MSKFTRLALELIGAVVLAAAVPTVGLAVVAEHTGVAAPPARAHTMAVEALPTTAEGFDWTDAGVGAAGAFGLVLLVAGASVCVLKSTGRSQAAS